ncbi:MAG: LysM peptidoglycan-binding domain-containing protein [Chloroflexota bacterium]
MIFRRVNHWIWIVGGLGLSLLVGGGFGAHTDFASRIAQAASSDSVTGASGLFDLETTQTPTPESRTYAVEPGDTLWSIAIKFYGNGTKYSLIQQANNLTDSTLRTGQILVIPFSETDKTPTPKATPLASVTPSPAPSIALSPPGIAPSAAPSSQSLAIVTPAIAPTPAAKSADPGTASLVPILSIVVNVLGAICLLGSLMCAVLSYDIYRRARHLARRRYIGNRVRAGL